LNTLIAPNFVCHNKIFNVKTNYTLAFAAFLFLRASYILGKLGLPWVKKAGENHPENYSRASELFGLSFSPAEKDSMISKLK